MLNIKKVLTEYGKKIQLLRRNNNSIGMKVITISNVTIPDGSVSSPSVTQINLADYGVTSSIWGCEVFLGSFQIPYISGTGVVTTWISTISGHILTITNTTTGWGTKPLYVLVFYAGDTV